MGRLYGTGKGKSSTALPYRRTGPAWLQTTTREVVQTICKLARKGTPPSLIGLQLRDSLGVAQVKSVTGRKITRLLKHNGLAPEIPEDMYCLIKRAVGMRKHLEKNRRDVDCKYHLILVESRIHRLARYYKRTKSLPSNWKYESANAASLISA